MELVEIKTKNNPPEVLVVDEQYLAVRDFVISGLAKSVPEFLSRDKAADLMVEWFPEDQLALASLYRTISENTPRLVA